MLPIQYPDNTQYMRYEYHRVREGPNYFVSYYKHSSRLHYDPKNCWRTLGVAKFTDTGKSLKAWCLEMDEAYGRNRDRSGAEKATTEGRSDTSFASEAIGDEESSLEEKSPTNNTKMIT